jgi:serine/threonine-protein kinase
MTVPPTRSALPEPQPDVSAEVQANQQRFRQVSLLGLGGMGRVLEVHDTRLDRRVAVKALRVDLENKPQATTLLEREARVTGGLEHPGIVPVYDAGHDPVVGPYYVMRVLRQPTLHAVLGRLRQGDPQALADYTLGRLLRQFIQICQAIDYAHSRGVVHCDLKPANILMGPFGEVLVVDWGFAQRIGESSPLRGGTAGYMAPEQLDARPDQVDARTDVFALGAILYELLSLRRAFPGASVDAMFKAITAGQPALPPPIPPGVAAGATRPVPIELEEICLRALALAPEARFPTARGLAEALELFLEGTREKERRLARAREFTEQGDALAASHDELEASRPDRIAEVAELHRTIHPWLGVDEKQALWDAEDRHSVLDALSIRTLRASISAYEHALEECPGHAGARRGLARIYWNELERARRRRDEFDRIYFEGLVQQFDDGSLAVAGQQAALELTTRPGPARASLSALTEQSRRLTEASEIWRGETPLSLDGLDPGNYLALIERPGASPIRYPLLLRAGQRAALEVHLDEAASWQEGEVFIPGGPALLGGHESSLFGAEPVARHVPSFFLSVFPVSFADYLSFLVDLRATDEALARSLAPCTSDGDPYWEWDGDDYVPTRITRWGTSLTTLLCLPVFGVDLACALAYAAWKSRVTGRDYRLPSEAQWEKAARGTDGRAYPWGDQFDASFCKMRDSRPADAMPEPSGSFPSDLSPFGARDMAGGIAEWVLGASVSSAIPGSLGPAASRGGAWCDWSFDCHAAARRLYSRSERNPRVGFRLARSIGP